MKKDSPAYQMIDQWMGCSCVEKIPELSRKLSVSKDAVQKAIEHIAELDPNPGSGFRPDSNSTCYGVIEWDGIRWVIHINNDYATPSKNQPGL